ncbi:ABC transporter permease [Nocardioides lentus]|uniref:ABC transporter permease n=1 Tax=Nocardioides lentus TaxID=338077 RepID=A0ABP5B2J0_9ACTN
MTVPQMEVTSEVSTAPGAPEQGQKEIAGKSPLRIAFERLRRDWVAMISLLVVLFFVVIAIFAPLIARLLGVSLDTPLASERINLINQLPLEGPPFGGFDPEHPFGVAPRSGQDNLAVWLYGARTSMVIATTAAVLSTVTGVVVGLLAGYLGGVVDRVLMFVTDVFLTIPFLLAALALSPILSDRFGTNPELLGEVKFYSVIGILTVFGWMTMARLIRGEVLSIREREFVQAARVIGVPTSVILRKEILPNLVAPIVVAFSLALPAYVAAEAGLSYLGIGVTDRPSWGQTVAGAVQWFESYPQYLWQPVIGIVLLVIALNLLGDSIRDALDPKTRR